ncbi:MAG: lipoate--protein ligase family protein [Paludibacteraceae bacterium]|nr:lipoate--protein ligase family protein [Paludibacteraceae bacterium]
MKVERVKEGLLLEEYLCLEQDFAKQVKEPVFFTWVVAPTVIFGKHQIRAQEVNEAYCRAHGIQIVQRKSGGGCVYADRGNVMISYITPSTHSETEFEQFIARLAGALQGLGYQAVTTAHNDILVDGHKVSGAACYKLPNATIVHATMLYDVNLEALEQAITPSLEKLEKHAVQSVRQRVRNLKDIRDIGTTQAFREQLEKLL